MGELADRRARRNRASRRALRTRTNLLSAALALFSEKGIEGTTIEQITERADVGKGSFYNHFENKEAVMIALVEMAVDGLAQKMNRPERSAGSLGGAIEHLVEAHADFFQNHYAEFLLLFQGRVLLKLQSETPEQLEEPYIRYIEVIENRIRPFAGEGIEPTRLRRFACALAGFVSGFFSFAMIGMSAEAMEKSLRPLRRAFVATSTAFLGRENVRSERPPNASG